MLVATNDGFEVLRSSSNSVSCYGTRLGRSYKDYKSGVAMFGSLFPRYDGLVRIVIVDLSIPTVRG